MNIGGIKRDWKGPRNADQSECEALLALLLSHGPFYRPVSLLVFWWAFPLSCRLSVTLIRLIYFISLLAAGFSFHIVACSLLV